MFGHQFYPTPPHIINLMLAALKDEDWTEKINTRLLSSSVSCLEGKSVLDPSAGKGDILTHIEEQRDRYSNKIDRYAIEIDPNLQAILRENEIPVIASDFLNYEPDMLFDVILMNPPFDKGADHLLHAIEISHNTDIICLLNAETLLNPNSRKKEQLLELIKKHGSYEIIGNVFMNAERKTSVNVALVKLHIEKPALDFDFSFRAEEKERISFDEDHVKNELVRDDKIGNMEIYFDEAKKAYKKYIEAEKEWMYRTKLIIGFNSYSSVKDYDSPDLNPTARYNAYARKMKLKMWTEVISKLELERYMTRSVRNNFNQFLNQQSQTAFNRENVTQFINMLLMNGANILQNAIIEVFDMLTENYYKENRMFVTGWKTNDRYKVNRKVIAPGYAQYGEYMSQTDLKQWGDNFKLDYNAKEKYTDIDKVLCFISGKSYENITTINEALQSQFDKIGKIKTGPFENTCESTFFDIKFYKKGTVHLKFKDTWLWNEFNMQACAGKNWLPDNERSKWEAKNKKEASDSRPAPTKPYKQILQIAEQPTLF